MWKGNLEKYDNNKEGGSIKVRLVTRYNITFYSRSSMTSVLVFATTDRAGISASCYPLPKGQKIHYIFKMRP